MCQRIGNMHPQFPRARARVTYNKILACRQPANLLAALSWMD